MFDRLNLFRQQIKTDDMTRHGLMMVTFNVISGLFMYLYQLFMGILLKPEQYGILFSLTSLFSIIMVIAPTISTTLAKFTSKFQAEGRQNILPYLWRFSLKRALLIGIVIFVLLCGLSPLISRFLKIDNPAYLIIIVLTILIVPLFSTNTGVLQGSQRFVLLGFVYSLQTFLLMSLGAVLVYLGFGVIGGLAVFPSSYFLVLLLTFFFLRNLRQSGNERTAITGIGSYAGLTLLAIFAITALTNLDVILVKHYLSAADAGSYSAISVLGRVALYAPAGVGMAMFPKTSEVFEAGGNYLRIFLKAVVLVLLIGGGVVLVYALFAPFIIEILFGDRYPLIAPYIPRYAAAMALFALAAIMKNFLLSVNRTKVAYSLLGAVIIQFALITLFHTSISQLVNILLISSILCVVLVSSFYLRRVGHKASNVISGLP